MATINVSVNTHLATVKIQRLLASTDAETILNVAGARIMSYVDESFTTRGRGRWRPLAPLTLAMRRRGGDVPLQDTGRYRQSFVSRTDNKTYVEIGSNIKTATGLPLSRIHEYGTGPFIIRAINKKVLAAQARSGEWFFFGKQVTHPGIPPRPVLPTKAVAIRLLRETIDAMLDRVGGRGLIRDDGPQVFRSNRLPRRS